MPSILPQPSPSVRGALMVALLYLVTACASAGPSDSRGGGRPALAELSTAIAELANDVNPAIVEIAVVGYTLGAGQDDAPALTRKRAGGSGVIVDPDGYIVTNYHVIEGGAEIAVTLTPTDAELRGAQSVLKPMGRTAPARVVGADEETDLAVLKIEGGPFPYLEIGDSESLKPGALVFAFGSPLGLENSVSMGVVSAVARQLRQDAPMIYIQTDAAINPGNSGGPLVDLDGRVIGINTLILSQGGGNEGIGLAAPSHIVRTIYERIRRDGYVRRGIIGTNAQSISPELARGLGLAQTRGVILGDVFPGGPAAAAGLMVGDILVSLDGKPMENARQFDVNLYLKKIGGTVDIEVIRDDRRMRFTVDVIERNPYGGPFSELSMVEESIIPELAIVAVPLDEDVAPLIPGLRGRSGVVVAARAGTGGSAGLQGGDVIYAVNGVSAGSLDELRRAIAGFRAGDEVVMQIQRRGRLQFLVAVLQ